jgi:hypothetical protein
LSPSAQIPTSNDISLSTHDAIIIGIIIFPLVIITDSTASACEQATGEKTFFLSLSFALFLYTLRAAAQNDGVRRKKSSFRGNFCSVSFLNQQMLLHDISTTHFLSLPLSSTRFV